VTFCVAVNVVAGNATSPRPGRDTQHVELDLTYLVKPDKPAGGQRPSRYSWRGLWAQCHVECQWFWQHDYQLQSNKFTALRKSLHAVVWTTYSDNTACVRGHVLLTRRLVSRISFLKNPIVFSAQSEDFPVKNGTKKRNAPHSVLEEGNYSATEWCTRFEPKIVWYSA